MAAAGDVHHSCRSADDDFANALNYAYDNQAMREKRVHRLYSGESISDDRRAHGTTA